MRDAPADIEKQIIGLVAVMCVCRMVAPRGTHPRLTLLSWLFPLLVTADVLAIANHFVLAIAGSIALLGASVVAASVWDRLAVRQRRSVGGPAA